MKRVIVSADLLAQVLSMAREFVEDIRSGLEDGTYARSENPDFFQQAAAVQEAQSLLDQPDSSRTAALVTVCGGVAEVCADPDVDVHVFDWDNHEGINRSTGIPQSHRHLAVLAGVPIDESGGLVETRRHADDRHFVAHRALAIARAFEEPGPGSEVTLQDRFVAEEMFHTRDEINMRTFLPEFVAHTVVCFLFEDGSRLAKFWSWTDPQNISEWAVVPPSRSV